MKKRFLTLALVLAMCLSLAIPAFAAANGDPKPEDTDPVATESAKPEESKDPETADSAKPEDKDPEPSDSAKPEDKDPEPSDSAKPEDKDPEPSESTDPVTPAAPEFTDVPDTAFCAAAVKWAVEKKITNGTEPTKFEPETTCSQIQILTFLYRAVQSAEDPDFVPASTDLIAAALWAKEKGMIDETFENNADCTRATAVSYIWQAFDKPDADKSEFKDVDAEAAYAAAVDWAVANGITNGTNMEAGEFSPDDTCTRGQIVTFLHRAYVEEARLTVAE